MGEESSVPNFLQVENNSVVLSKLERNDWIKK
jgi:hypothetical protein